MGALWEPAFSLGRLNRTHVDHVIISLKFWKLFCMGVGKILSASTDSVHGWWFMAEGRGSGRVG